MPLGADRSTKWVISSLGDFTIDSSSASMMAFTGMVSSPPACLTVATKRASRYFSTLMSEGLENGKSRLRFVMSDSVQKKKFTFLLCLMNLEFIQVFRA